MFLSFISLKTIICWKHKLFWELNIIDVNCIFHFMGSLVCILSPVCMPHFTLISHLCSFQNNVNNNSSNSYMCMFPMLLSASFLRHVSLTIAGLRAPLSRFLEGVLYKYPEWMNNNNNNNNSNNDNKMWSCEMFHLLF